MTSQAPRTSAIEAATQSAVGLILGFIVTMWFTGAAMQSSGIVATMFIVGVIRQYVIRRIFDKCG